jgi:hypothetical protein
MIASEVDPLHCSQTSTRDGVRLASIQGLRPLLIKHYGNTMVFAGVLSDRARGCTWKIAIITAIDMGEEAVASLPITTNHKSDFRGISANISSTSFSDVTFCGLA